MLLNTASQSIGAQMITAADGTAFTGSVTVAVTVDSGTQATGTVGSGACAHEGNGYHSYSPSQAETNGAHIAFTFTGTGAIPVTTQVFTRAGDAFTRLGAPAGASVSVDIAAVKSDTAAILTDTAEIGTAGAGLTALATQASLNAVDDLLDTEVAAIFNRIGAPVGVSISADVAAVQTAVDALSIGASPDILADTTIATLATQTSFTLTAGSADDNAYNGMAAIFTDQTTAAQKWLSFVSDYVGSTKTVTLEAAPGFTIATGDTVAIMAAGGSTSVPVPAALSGTQTFDLTGDITGNLSGSVGSVTGAVGSVTGAVGSVTGAVGSVTGNVGGNVVGSVASVTAGVTLADGAHGGSSATITAKSIAVTNSDAGGVAVALTGSGTGNSHALSLLSTNGHALAAGSTNGNAINAASTSADAVSIAGGTNSDGLQIAGNGTGVDIRANITGNITGTLSELSSAIADSVPADGTIPSVKQALYMLTQFMLERSVSGTTCTVAKADGTTALFTLTLSDATTPVSITRAT